MAINFPPITVNGQTYDYQGIRYTADFTVAPGFWQVTTPGTFGVASSAEVDAGTDAVKYPQQLWKDLSTMMYKLVMLLMMTVLVVLVLMFKVVWILLH